MVRPPGQSAEAETATEDHDTKQQKNGPRTGRAGSLRPGSEELTRAESGAGQPRAHEPSTPKA